MAGDWLKWCKGLARKPEVLHMASQLGISRHDVAARLMEVWEWADDNAELVLDLSEFCPGVVRLPSASASIIDDFAGISGFADSMSSVGWVTIRDGRIEFPKFSRHNGKLAKTRALDADRKRTKRAGKVAGSPHSVPNLSTSQTDKRPQNVRSREEKREDKKETPLPPCLNTDVFQSAWADWQTHRRETGHPLKPTAMKKQLARLEKLGHDRAVAALEHSTTNSYQGIYEPDAKDQPPKAQRVLTEEEMKEMKGLKP